MIVQIEEAVFNSQNTVELESITKIVRMAFEKKFLWDIDTLFIEDLETTYWYQNYLSPKEKDSLIETMIYIQELDAYITETHKHYLTTIKISSLSISNCFTPVEAYNILNSKAYIILENGHNDWKFITAIIKKYKKHGKRKNIYKLLENYLDNKWIESVHAGGKGDIKNIIIQKINSFGISVLRLATIFDSDKKSKNDNLQEGTIKLIEYLKNKSRLNFEIYEYETDDLVVWHMLYKRELENYLPINIVKDNYIAQNLQGLSSEELDFLSLQDYINFPDNQEQSFKREFPNLFLKDNLTKEHLEQICEHHKVRIKTPNGILEEVSEIEQILIKLAKII